MIESQIRGVQFFLREHFWGRFSFHRSLPIVSDAFPDTPNQTPEHRFYELLGRNGSYLPALRRLFRNAELLGVELDGLRRYWNLYRRADYARAYAQVCGARILFGDFKKLSVESLSLPTQGAVLITLFYPFVSEHPCLKWGLPVEFSDFNQLILKIKNLHAQNPALDFHFMSAHQGEWEAEKVRALWPSPHSVHTFQYRFQDSF